MELVIYAIVASGALAAAYKIGHMKGFEDGMNMASDIALDQYKPSGEKVRSIMQAVQEVVQIPAGCYSMLKGKIEDIIC